MTKQQTSHLLHSLPGSALEVFTAFLKLGLTSFGGPIAHLGHFRRELVEQRGWVSDSAYAQLLGLCQFLPGPADQFGNGLNGCLRACSSTLRSFWFYLLRTFCRLC